MSEAKNRYSEEELKEFEELILDKLEKAKKELSFITDTLSKKSSNDTGTGVKVLEDGADTAEKQNLIQLAARQAKFMTNLENALMRIKNGTYGVCIESGKLIGKDRLKAVPHTQHSIEAKLKQ